MELIRSTDVETSGGLYTLTVSREDLFALYPGMVRYTLSVSSKGQSLAIFRTNSYEYSPTVPLEAERVTMDLAHEWEQELRSDPQEFLASHGRQKEKSSTVPAIDVVVIEGSPRADGNCSILAGWASDAARNASRTVQVIYPHDMNIHSCIGCYQCYNTGTCTFDDDMGEIIDAIRHAILLIVCTPVYTNSVPGGLKLLIDRCQAYHAERTFSGNSAKNKKGLLLSVAGRKGRSHFLCVTTVINAFMRNIGIEPSGELLIDGIDELHDIRNIPDLKRRVRAMVQNAFMAQQ